MYIQGGDNSLTIIYSNEKILHLYTSEIQDSIGYTCLNLSDTLKPSDSGTHLLLELSTEQEELECILEYTTQKRESTKLFVIGRYDDDYFIEKIKKMGVTTYFHITTPACDVIDDVIANIYKKVL